MRGAFRLINSQYGKCLLRHLLFDKKISQFELSIRTGIDSSLISKYVNNKKEMTLLTAYKIAKVLNCKIEELYDWQK
ncbi:helix-turn-helix domain-containing protein [Cytobacillus praedii]|uniref:XRE family transcriptional regulator n=1 Tax=Cytobacillus praedii TaxID=1742358 RepID=A0A4R1ARL3_9BACI|nr:helix-turn-helix transcriptional regulator [Cytobacillus praedii]TCJ00435.1 XRE family transcriptional regulator [Cytobacillus praedii]